MAVRWIMERLGHLAVATLADTDIADDRDRIAFTKGWRRFDIDEGPVLENAEDGACLPVMPSTPFQPTRLAPRLMAQVYER